MKQPYEAIHKEPSPLWAEGCPALLWESAQIQDELGRQLFSCRFENRSRRVVCALYIRLLDRETGKLIQEQAYLGQQAAFGERFGDNAPFLLAVHEPTSIRIAPRRVVFQDGTCWEAPAGLVFEPVPDPARLPLVELESPHREEPPAALPDDSVSLEETGLVPVGLEKASTENDGSAKAEAEQPPTVWLSRKRLTALGILGLGAMLLMVLILIDRNIHVPQKQYASAMALMEQERYQEAEKVFVSLGDYQDSLQRTEEARKGSQYQNAVMEQEQGNFGNAAILFEMLGDYRDAPEKAVACRIDLAQKFAQQGEWKRAYAIASEYPEQPVMQELMGQCQEVNAWELAFFFSLEDARDQFRDDRQDETGQYQSFVEEGQSYIEIFWSQNRSGTKEIVTNSPEKPIPLYFCYRIGNGLPGMSFDYMLSLEWTESGEGFHLPLSGAPEDGAYEEGCVALGEVMAEDQGTLRIIEAQTGETILEYQINVLEDPTVDGTILVDSEAEGG